MSKPKLSNQDKEAIVDRYLSGKASQRMLAIAFGVHRKTIYNVLRDSGALHQTTCSFQEANMLELLRKHNVKLRDLKQLLGVKVAA